MKRPVQHETDAAGQRLLRAAFEGFGWVVNVTAGRTYWLLPQLDASVVGRLDTLNDNQSITLHLPVINELPASKTSFVEALQRADAALSVRAARRVQPTLGALLGEQILGTDTEATIRAFQAHSDALRLAEAYSRTVAGDLDKTFKLISELLEAPGSAVEHKFSAWLIWEMAEQNRQIAVGASDRSRVETSNRVAQQIRHSRGTAPRT